MILSILYGCCIDYYSHFLGMFHPYSDGANKCWFKSDEGIQFISVLVLSSSDCCLCLLSTIRMSVIVTEQWLNAQMVHVSKIVLTLQALKGHLDSDWSKLIT